MELQPTQPQTPDITQDVRVSAEMRKLTLTPIHDNVAPEALPDAEIVAKHAMDGALPNSPDEYEATTAASPAQQVAAKSAHRTALAYSTAIVSVLVVATSIAFLSR